MDTINPNETSPFYSGNMTPPKKSYGPLIAVLIILFIIIIGGLYFLGQRMNRAPYNLESEQNSNTDPVVKSLQNQSSSDELEFIEADLEATDLENLDQGAAALEAELQ